MFRALPRRSSAVALRLGCWNQHRQGSYAQRDCSWVQQLKRLGADRQERDELLKTLQLEYQHDELRHWARDLDVLALQEVDEALRRSLGVGDAADRWVESAPHVDGRGQPVDSSCALLLSADFSLLRKTHCQLRVPLSHGKRGQFAERDHCGVLLQGRSFQLALCSVHLHPPAASAGLVEAGYLAYLAPLKEMMSSLAECNGSNVHLALLGDWNCSAEQLRQLTEADDFWRSFQAVTAAGPTAFETNPCASGDFMLYRGPMQGGHLTWRVAEGAGRERAERDFAAFQEFGRAVLADSCARLPWLRAASSAVAARKQLQRLEMELQGLLPQTPLADLGKVAQASAAQNCRRRSRHRPNAPVRKELLQELLAESSEISAKLEQHHQRLLFHLGQRTLLLEKGLETSDHKPLVFETIPQLKKNNGGLRAGGRPIKLFDLSMGTGPDWWKFAG